MSKADTSSNTSSSDASTSRRSVLSIGGALTAGLLLPLSGAALATPQAKTAIQQRFEEREAFALVCEQFLREAEAASGRFFEMVPPVPQEMRGYMIGLDRFYSEGRFSDRKVKFITVDGWRYLVNRPLTPAEKGPMAHIMNVTLQRARAREILPIAERYEAAVEQARAASGSVAASQAAYDAGASLWEMDRSILRMAPETFSDLLVQVHICEVNGFTDDDGGDFQFPDCAAQSLVNSIKTIAAKASA